jgi:transcriptional regulator with XRE-family HTH domain
LLSFPGVDAARILNMARRRAGLSQRELARRSGIPQPSISRIERGVVSPTVDTLERLVQGCGMELEPVDRPREDDVDRTLIREHLSMTPAERARWADSAWNELAPFRRAALRT